MAAPRFAVIVPVLHFRADEPVLVRLREMGPPPGGWQVLVAEGHQPSRQRNAALARAQGEIIVFLDNDCQPADDFWQKLDEAFARPEVEIVGGPALLRSGAGPGEEIFHALLTHTLIVGTIASRYAARGTFREAHQTELILCNLAVRREVFNKIGTLSSELYPNEENEWLDRAHAAGFGAYYDPGLQISRPQRTTPGQMCITLLRYGIGRTRQFKVSGWKFTFHQILPLLPLITVLALLYLPLIDDFVALWLIASLIVALTCENTLSWWQRAMAGLLAPLVPLTYSIGQIAGWFMLGRHAPSSDREIALFDENGQRLG